jgi:hypothetical protein
VSAMRCCWPCASEPSAHASRAASPVRSAPASWSLSSRPANARAEPEGDPADLNLALEDYAVTLRRLDSVDLAAISSAHDLETNARALLRRCWSRRGAAGTRCRRSSFPMPWWLACATRSPGWIPSRTW